MKRKIIIWVLLFVVFVGKAQEKESFKLFTDRDLYASGETLLLKVFAPVNEQSGIVNIDLINNRGGKITGIIMEVIDHEADGYIYLPDSLSSGCYLVRTSTRSDNVSTIKEIYIANRFTGISESNADLRPSGIVPYLETPIQTIQIDGVEKFYKTREKSLITLHLTAELLAQIDGNLFMSISEVTPEYNPKTFFMTDKSETNQIIVKEGIILEGIVTDLKTNQPFKNAVVYLSIPDSIPAFKYDITGENGRFIFQLKNYYGKK